MAGNSFGSIFKITSFGESHGPAIGVVIDGCPAGLKLDMDFIKREMDKRKPGQSKLTTERKETDQIEFISGLFEGVTTGTPLAMLIKNKDHQSKDYDKYKDAYRPSHADFTYEKKYGVRDHRGGGRASARETALRVASGAVAKLILKQFSISIQAYVSQIGPLKVTKPYQELDLLLTESNPLRCPDPELVGQMQKLIEQLKGEGDSVGGRVTCVVQNCPVGLGDPVYDKLEADLAKAQMSINASKGFEIGSGFSASTMHGSEHNDPFIKNDQGEISLAKNHAGGVLGGISTGGDIYFDVAFKPTSTIAKVETIMDKDGQSKTLPDKKGRHDPCIVPRAVPVVEAMTALVLVDHLLRNRASRLNP